MPETRTDIYDNKSQLLHQVGTSRHFHTFYSNKKDSEAILWLSNAVF